MPWYDPEHLDWYAKGSAAVIGVATAVFLATKHVRRVWKRVVEFAKLEAQYVDLSHQITELTNVVHGVAEQFKHNGGSSLADALSRVEKAQYWQQERVKALLSEVPYGVWESHNDGECYWANDVLIQWAGGRLSDLIGQNWQNIVDPRDREVVVKEWESAVEQQRDYRQGYRLMNHRTAEIHDVLAKATLLKDKDGHPLGFIGTVTMIT